VIRKRVFALALFVVAPVLAGTPGADPRIPEPRVELDRDRVPRTHTGGNVLLVGGTVLTVTGPRQDDTDVLVLGGKIAAIGKNLDADPSVTRIDCRGRFVAPGAIDCHSHIAIREGVNEMAEKISAEVRIGDVIDPTDVSIYRALAGGTTCSHLLHGSGNPIGGQDAVVKLKWKKTADEMRLKAAPKGIKFALGENPTRQDAFPHSRMGMAATYRRTFTAGKEYAKEWQDYRDALARGEDRAPPRRDLRLETIAGILDGTIRIHCHCYRADEILELIKVCDEFGVKIGTFQHCLEGYRVATEIARHGAGVSTFSDWWAYKIEAYEAIPANAAICTRAGIITSVNSDSEEVTRHLYLEAAKCVRYGGLGENEALALCTINPAKQLGIDRWTGSLEVGKDGDISVWTGHPLSSYAHPVLSLVEGEVYFERAEPVNVVETLPVTPGLAPGNQDHALPDPTSFVVRRDPGAFPEPQVNAGGVYAIVDARIEPVSGPVISRGTILVRDGKIAAIGANLGIPDDATIVKGDGLTVTPGFIDTASWLGLVEIEMLKVTRDDHDSGELQPDLVALSAIHPESEHILISRAAGITASLTTPQGGLISGQASMIKCDGWTVQEMSLGSPAGLVVEFPDRPGAPPEGGTRPRKFERLEVLEKFFDRARADMERRARTRGTALTIPPEPRLEALAPYLEGKLPVLFHADDARTILDAIAFADAQKVKPVIVGGRDSWKVAAFLAKKDVPVLLGPVMDVPAHEWDPYDSCYAAASVLDRAGVRFAIRSGGGYAGQRNLPFEAAMAASYGLGRARALAAITRAPAEILGLTNRGTLEPGKAADLVVAQGDPLEATSRVRYVFIDGKPVSLESKQTRLEAAARARLEAQKQGR
jgi:imidazolonepropionase-like amidohydrolase